MTDDSHIDDDHGEGPARTTTETAVESDGGVDAETDGGADVETDGTDDFDPVRVFPDATDSDLRSGADDCYKCSTCDTSCPVAEVDESFPGPKFQGPEQWRLKRREDRDVDDSISKCSNCMRCDSACPSDVPLSQMHNTARAQYVDDQVSTLSLSYWRDRLLANYGTLGRLGARFPRLANAITGNALVQGLAERVLGITAERDFPTFATQTFREWYAERGGEPASVENARRARRERDDPVSADKRVAYFHGDYANYNTPTVGRALVRVFESFGYAVLVPDQRCSGTPMFANGMLEDARRAATVNVETLRGLVDDGVDVVCSCTSCSMALRQEYPELFDIPGTDRVGANTYDAVEYLRLHEGLDDALESAQSTPTDDHTPKDPPRDPADTDTPGDRTARSSPGDRATNDKSEGGEGPASFAYHAPCHARNQGLGGQTLEVLEGVEDVEAIDVGDSCSGISGTYGWKREHYETSMAVGEEMFEHMDDAAATTGLTECPTCAMQMTHGTGYEVSHTLEVLADVLLDDDPR